jgi:Na+/proline symporter
MDFSTLDWSIIIGFFALSLGIGIWVSKKSGESTSNFFVAGRNMPWWLLGVSMVATTFAADTPLLVTEIVRENGVSGNWVWWAFLLTGLLTTFVYARLWRRAGLLTDLEFYEIRYSGPPASFLRGFRAVYLGLIFNIAVLGTVCLAGVKLGWVLLGLEPWETLSLAAVVTLVYSALGGLRAVILTDLFQFAMAMVGSVWAALYLLDLPEVGGLDALLAQPAVASQMPFLPSLADRETWLTLLVLPLAVQWWSTWYPGNEPGGGGYVAQRILASKNEKHATAASLFFNVAHIALRPWPWILIAFASLAIFPDLTSLQATFPDMPPNKVKQDIAYAAMLWYLPVGLSGLIVASLIAAFMSTLSTHLNWGASYLTNDVYKRFIKPNASEKEQVWFGRLSTVAIMILAGVYALYLQSAKQAFDIILLIRAGTGLIYILRWFWWRINAWSEIVAMAASFIVAILFQQIELVENNEKLETAVELVAAVGITTAAWVLATFLTRPTSRPVLEAFVARIRPEGPGWKGYGSSGNWGLIPSQIIAMIAGTCGVYAILFATGFALYGDWLNMVIATGVAALGGLLVYRYGFQN